ECAWQSSRGLFAELAEQKFLGERNALEFEKLNALLHPAIEREADLPRTREHVRVFDGRFVHHVIRAHRRVPLDDVQRIAVVVTGAIEPRLLALACDIDN